MNHSEKTFLLGLLSYWEFKIRDQDFGDPGVKTPLSNARDEVLIPDWGTEIPHALECSQKI